MKVKKNELLNIIAKVKPGLSSKEIIEQANHLIFTCNEIVTYNDRICVMHPFDFDTPFSVKADEFSKILSGISEDEIDLTVSEDTINIKTDTTKASLSIIVDEAGKVEHLIEAIQEEIEKDDAWLLLPKEFLSGVYLCAFSANKDVATGVRSCVAIKGDSIFSTDNIRASNYIMDKSMDDVMIPAKDALELVKYEVKEYAISENWIHFTTSDGIIFNCKSMKGDYPYQTIESLFKDLEPSLTFPAGLREIIQSVTILAEGELDINKMITVSVGKSKIVVKAEKERGWIEKSMTFKFKGEPFSFNINPIFFSQILYHATDFSLMGNIAQFSTNNFYHVLSLPITE